MANAKGINVWATDWLAQVDDGTLTMSQRKLSTVEKHGGIKALRNVARTKGLHLALIIDDKGQELIAASKNPFKVIC